MNEWTNILKQDHALLILPVLFSRVKGGTGQLYGESEEACSDGLSPTTANSLTLLSIAPAQSVRVKK